LKAAMTMYGAWNIWEARNRAVFRSEGHNTSEGSAGDQDGSDQQENGLQSVRVIEF